MNLYCIRWLNITYSITDIKLKYNVDRANKLYSSCVDCALKKVSDVDNEYFSDYSEELHVRENLRYYLLKYFGEKLNKKN